jgi:hypothetical protein
VYRRLSEQAAARLRSSKDLESALVTLRRPETGDAYVRMLARTLLEGHEPSEFLGRSPAMDELVRWARAELGDDVDAEVLVAVTMVLTLGARLLGPFFAVALDIDDPARLDDAIDRVIAALPSLLAERDGQP